MKILGLMSGTSLDAIDAALGEFSLAADGALELTPLGHLELPWPDGLREELLAAATGAGDAAPSAGATGAPAWCRWHALAGREFGAAAATALRRLGPADLVVSHGQTLHHLLVDGAVVGTLQIGAPAEIAEATGLPVVSDLRSADVAAGGQGAPLASTLDAMWFGGEPTAVLNLGGIANVTLVGLPGGPVTGDTGPANALLDSAAAALGLRCDEGGRLAAAGRVDEDALARLLADPFYARALPKSTGREHFHARYVAERLGGRAPSGPDLFATLTELSARTVAAAIRSAVDAGDDGAGEGATGPGVRRLVVSGGGTANPTLMDRLRQLCGVPVLTSDELGLPAAAKEAYLMALLGWLSIHGLPGVVTRAEGGTLTGARSARVLGSLTPPYLPEGLRAALAPTTPDRPPRRLRVRAVPQEGPS